MKLAELHLRAQRGVIERLFQMPIDQTAKALRQLGLWVADGRFVGSTAQAGAEARLPGGFRQREKEDVFTLRPPRGARGAAIDSGRAHAVIEQPIVARVARLDGPPEPLLRGCRRRRINLDVW